MSDAEPTGADEGSPTGHELDAGREPGFSEIEITNCHLHTFTHAHTPDRFAGLPAYLLAQWAPTRTAVIALLRLLDRNRRTRFGRYAEILATSYQPCQAKVFEIVRGFYPQGTRFVVLPMDMTQMRAGRVHASITEQHAELAALRDSLANNAGSPCKILPFAAVDPRHPDIVTTTRRLLEQDGFCGIKLYPPTGYHPNDPALHELYSFANDHDIPVLSHCSRPAQVQFRGNPTEEMRIDPDTGKRLSCSRYELLTRFTSPDAYKKLLTTHTRLRVCLAHFGGAGDWNMYLQHPWGASTAPAKGSFTRLARKLRLQTPAQGPDESWLPKILEMIRSGDYPNLWTDISYTLYADDEYVYLLKALLADTRILRRVLFGSDFYVVENAPLEERRRSVRIRGVLGESLFRTIAQDNPRAFLGTRCR